MHKDDANPEWLWGTEISEVDGRYLIMSVAKDTSRVISYLPSFPDVNGPHLSWCSRKIWYGLQTSSKTPSDRICNGTKLSTNSTQHMNSTCGPSQD